MRKCCILLILMLLCSLGDRSQAADPGDAVLFRGTIGAPEIDEPIIKMGGVLVSTVGATSGDYAAAQLATTGNITLSGEQTVDGVLTAVSAVVVWQQTTPTQNGIYTSSSGAWTRRADADTSAELAGNKAIYVQGGVLHANKVFRIANTGTVTLGTTPIVIVPEPAQWHLLPLQTIAEEGAIACNPPTGQFIGAIAPVVGAGGPIMLGSPQLVAGTRVGQFCLILGQDHLNTVELGDGSGVQLAQEPNTVVFDERTRMMLWWSGTIWQQVDHIGMIPENAGGSSGLQANCDVDCILRNLSEEFPFVLAPAGQPGPEERIFSPDGNFYRLRLQADGSHAGPERLVIAPDTCWDIAATLGTPPADQTVGRICNVGGTSLDKSGIFITDAADIELAPTAMISADNLKDAYAQLADKASRSRIYLAIGGSAVCNANPGTSYFWFENNSSQEDLGKFPSPAGCYTGLKMKAITGNMPSGQTGTFALRVNSVTSALTCSITAGTSICSSDVSVCVLDGDLVSMTESCAGGTVPVTIVNGSMDFMR